MAATSLPFSLRAAPLPLVPVLETADLRLRAPQPTDLPEAATMHADPAFYRFLGNKPNSEEEVWRRMLAQVGHWAMLGYGAWAIEEKTTGCYLGTVGFFDFQRDLTPSLKGELEAGWVLAPHAHGRGYASQALQATLAWAEAHLPADRITCIIDPDNAASLRLAQKFGFQEFALTTYHNSTVILLERLREK